MQWQDSAELESEGRARILHAAYPLFVENGYKAVSMQQIANAATIHKATLYHHFQNKDELFGSVVQLALTQLRAEVTAIVEQGGSPREQLIAAASQAFSRTQSDFGRLMTDLHENIAPDMRNEILKEKPLPWELFASIIQRVIDEEQITGITANLATSLFIGMVWGQIWMRKAAWTSCPLDRQLATTIVDILFDGLRGLSSTSADDDV